MNVVLAANDQQSLWLQPGQDPWSLPFSAAELNPSFPSDLDMMDHAGFAQWNGDVNEQGRGEGINSTTAPEFIPFPLPTTNASVRELSSASPRDADPADRTVSSRPSYSRASSKLSREDQIPDLHSYLNQESLGTGRLVQTYFAEFHPYWPILHGPSFDIENASHLLLGSVILLASWLEGRQDHRKLAPLVFDAITATLLVRKRFTLSISRSPDQRCVGTQPLIWQGHPTSFLADFASSFAMRRVHCLLSSKYERGLRGHPDSLSNGELTKAQTPEPMLARAVHFNSILISNCRHLGVFNGQHAHHELGDCPNAAWLVQEQLNRYTLFQPLSSLLVNSTYAFCAHLGLHSPSSV